MIVEQRQKRKYYPIIFTENDKLRQVDVKYIDLDLEPLLKWNYSIDDSWGGNNYDKK